MKISLKNPCSLEEMRKIVCEMFALLTPADCGWTVSFEVVDSERNGSNRETTELVCDFGVSGFAVNNSLHTDFEGLLETLTALQFEVIEEMRLAVPVCEGHSHPAELNLEEEQLVWRCPSTRRQVSETKWDLRCFQTEVEC
jgi:hypothetical protein